MEIKAPEPVSQYPEAYLQISHALKSANALEIGDPMYREKTDLFKDKDGEIRAASLGMDKLSRVGRTLTIIHLTDKQLAELHRREVRKGYFIIRIKETFKLNYESTLMTDEVVRLTNDHNEKNRPECEKFNGVSIPPYFPPDNTFDGMFYHQAWDMGIVRNKSYLYLPAPRTKSGRRAMDNAE